MLHYEHYFKLFIAKEVLDKLEIKINLTSLRFSLIWNAVPSLLEQKILRRRELHNQHKYVILAEFRWIFHQEAFIFIDMLKAFVAQVLSENTLQQCQK